MPSNKVLIFANKVPETNVLAPLQVERLKRELNVSQQHLGRVRGVTDATGLDVFAANAKVKEQAAAMAALRSEVRAVALLYMLIFACSCSHDGRQYWSCSLNLRCVARLLP